MGQLDNAFPESLDDILEAVKESARGRWFLEGYEARLKKAETTRILDAIAKLESHLSAHNPSSADAALVERARAAIAATRRDIADITDKPASLSVEGQLFARLASLSKEAFATAPGLGAGVACALQLVDTLDRELSAPQVLATIPVGGASFFKQDDAVFEPAPAAKPVVAVARAEVTPEPPTRGAKLVIHRINTPQIEQAAPAIGEDATPVATEVPASAATAQAALAEPPVFMAEVLQPEQSEILQSRIVIIRRKADEMNDVPLLGAESGEPASAA
jgi:hypothetical protein